MKIKKFIGNKENKSFQHGIFINIKNVQSKTWMRNAFSKRVNILRITDEPKSNKKKEISKNNKKLKYIVWKTRDNLSLLKVFKSIFSKEYYK